MNKNSNLTKEQLETIKSSFPADLPVKVFLLSEKQESVQESLRQIFREMMLPPKSWNIKESSKNKYKVITILTYMDSYDTMLALYEKIKKIEGVVQAM